MSTGKKHPGPRKTYANDSPGAKRASIGVTLTELKKVLASSLTRSTQDRRTYREKGLLG